MKEAILLINRLTEDPTDDEKDVLDQANEVESALNSLGFNTGRLFMGLNLEEIRNTLLKNKPDLVFNLVESLDGKANLIHLAPALLESLDMKFTGCSLESMFISSNKILTKKILNQNKIDTPRYYHSSDKFDLDPSKKYISKPLWEDASVGITDLSVFPGNDSGVLKEFRDKWGDRFFVEEFIEGREYNVSVLGGKPGPEVMPLAEIIFKDYPENKPRIVGYAAKWNKDTFEYANTIRTFNFDSSDLDLRNTIKDIALGCWNTFGLKGYSRIDFRVDQNNVPYVLEINANPCLAKDAGFFAACEQAGLSFEDVVSRIINNAYE